jgi:hypothetical protein
MKRSKLKSYFNFSCFSLFLKVKILNLGRGKDPGSEILHPEKKSSRIPDPWGSGSAILLKYL